MADPQAPDDPGRRRVLGWMAAAAGLATTVFDGGCGPGGPDDGAVAVALADLPEGVRTTVRWREQSVEVVRTAAGVRARSLLCTHMSCTVRWDEGEGRYVCPCHAGRFDADGAPVSGPPTAPLRAVATTLDGDTVWIGRG